MKKIALLFMVSAAMISCKQEQKTNTSEEVTASKEIAYLSFGMEIVADDALTTERMASHYRDMAAGDTIPAKFIANINEVCSKQGCWMKLDLGDENEAMVRFKDYGFFMPLNADGEVIVNGKAYVTETSVEELKHYAEDAGKSKEEIEAITEPERTYAFEADGVLLKEN